MSEKKKVPEFFKNLFNLRPGKNIFVRFIVKGIFWIFVIFAIFYGLIYVPFKSYAIEESTYLTQVAKIDRGCQISAANTLGMQVQGILNQIAKLEKEDKEKNKKEIEKLKALISQQNQQKAFVDLYNNCVYLEGYDFLIQPLVDRGDINKLKQDEIN